MRVKQKYYKSGNGLYLPYDDLNILREGRNHNFGYRTLGFGSYSRFIGDGVSYRLDGVGDHLTMPDSNDWDWANDFSIDCWIYPDSNAATDDALWSHAASGDDRFHCIFKSNVSTNWNIGIRATTGASGHFELNTTGEPIAEEVWSHVEVTRTGTTIKMFVNGVEEISDSITGTIGNIAALFEVGEGSNSGALPLSGYIDEFRISDTARHTSGFTPEIKQYKSDGNTLALIHCGEAIVSGTTGSGATFVESSSNGRTVTEVAGAIRETTIIKF
tara:strand:- start:2533 stop:3351 length:819 start_codon:yes stop_codon:yes gene_type:complete